MGKKKAQRLSRNGFVNSQAI